MKQLSLFTSSGNNNDKECILELLSLLEESRHTKRFIHKYVERYEFGKYPKSMITILEKLRKQEYNYLVKLKECYNYDIWDIIDYSKPFYR